MDNLTYLSIGLNVGDREPDSQLARTLGICLSHFGAEIRSVSMGRSEWDGVPERFVQIGVIAPNSRALYVARILARVLSQECIAVLPSGATTWSLVYADGHHVTGGDVTEFPIISRE